MINKVKTEKINVLPNLLRLIEEIKINFKTDSVAKKLLGIRADFIVKKLNTTDNIDEIEHSIDAILRHLGNNRYLVETQTQLREAIENPREKKLIFVLSRTLTSELLNLGYDKQFILFIKGFITPIEEITSLEEISKYFELFKGIKKEFIIFRLVNRNFKLFRDITDPLGIISMR